MKPGSIRFSTFPRTEPPLGFVEDLVAVFRQHESEIATEINLVRFHKETQYHCPRKDVTKEVYR